MIRPIIAAFTILAVIGASEPVLAVDDQDEMLVTVRKTSESLQDVPLAVTSLPAQLQ